MAILKPQFSADNNLFVSGLNGLLDTSSTISDVLNDNTVSLYVDGILGITVNAAAATTGTLDIYMIEGATATYVSTTAKKSNMRRISSVELNGTTTVSKNIWVYAIMPYWKLYFENNSGATIDTASIGFTGVNYTDV